MVPRADTTRPLYHSFLRIKNLVEKGGKDGKREREKEKKGEKMNLFLLIFLLKDLFFNKMIPDVLFYKNQT